MKQDPTHRDVESLNHNILKIDLDDLAVESMEQRIELTLAAIFDTTIWDGPGGPGQPCGQFTCTTNV